MAKVKIIPSLVVLFVLVFGLLVGEQLGTEPHSGNAASAQSAKRDPVNHKAPPASPTAPNLQQLSERMKNLENTNWALSVVSLGSLGFSIVAVGASLYTLLKGSAAKKSSGFSQSASNSNNNTVQNSVGQDYNRLIQLVNARLRSIENRLQELEQQRATSERGNLIENRLQVLEQERATFERGNSTHSNVTPTPRKAQTPVNQHPQASIIQSQQAPKHQQQPSSPDEELVSAYNSNPDSLSNSATKVSETQDSINQRRAGTSQPAVFEKIRQGSYWILTEGGVEYLVPKGNLKINKYNYETVETLFECRGYRSEESSEFQLIKPARVSSRGEKWQLVEPGVLQF